MTVAQRNKLAVCGCEDAAHSKSLITVDAGLQLIAHQLAGLPGCDKVPCAQGLGRVLAEPVVACAASPPFDAAAMDGYAVQTRSLTGQGPWTLTIGGRQAAGEVITSSVGELSAVRILTGAPVPPGADSVIRQEDVVCRGATATIFRKPRVGENIRPKGSGLSSGQTVLEAGCLLDPRSIASAASAGATCLKVRRKLRVAVLVTGSEVLPAGAPRTSAQIWDVNTPLFAATFSSPLFELLDIVHVGDNAESVRAAFSAIADSADLIITTGGVSVGEEDHVLPTAQALGVSLVFSGVAIKPGKPVSLGTTGSTVWLGLPGNPLAAFVTWQVFGRAVVSALLCANLHPQRRYAVTARPVHRQPGRSEFRPARLVAFDAEGRDVVDFDDKVDSSHVVTLARADGFVVFPSDQDTLVKGSLVEFLPFCAR